MKRSSLVVCCGITLLYLSPGLDSMTVSPIVYLTTAVPDIAAAPIGYHGDGGQTGYYGSASGKSGYYGGQSRNHGGGPTGYYGRGSTAAGTTAYGSYGHRSVPESAVRGAIRPVRDERSYALYESPNTYEYMSNPPRKSGKVSRVPETERLPPGDDVELIDAGDNRRPAVKDRRRDGDGGERPRDYDDRPRGHQHDNRNSGKRTAKPKSGRKPPAVRDDDYANDDGDAEQVGSSSSSAGNVREGATVKKPRRDEQGTGRKHKDRRPDSAAPVKHKIHKKNEYSKKQQFFDEEHVDHGKKKPEGKAKREGRKTGSEPRKRIKKKRQQQQQSTAKPVERPAKRVKKDDRGANRVVRQGYGQVVAVR